MHIIITQDQKDVIREDKVVISRKTTFLGEWQQKKLHLANVKCIHSE